MATGVAFAAAFNVKLLGGLIWAVSTFILGLVQMAGRSCQGWGAAELLDHLLKLHAHRRDDGDPGFGIVAKRCLDKCESAAIVLVHTPDGTAGLPEATNAQLDEALAQLFEV